MVSPLLMWWVIRHVVAVGVPPFCKKGGGPNSRRPLLATLARGKYIGKKFYLVEIMSFLLDNFYTWIYNF